MVRVSKRRINTEVAAWLLPGGAETAAALVEREPKVAQAVAAAVLDEYRAGGRTDEEAAAAACLYLRGMAQAAAAHAKTWDGVEQFEKFTAWQEAFDAAPVPPFVLHAIFDQVPHFGWVILSHPGCATDTFELALDRSAGAARAAGLLETLAYASGVPDHIFVEVAVRLLVDFPRSAVGPRLWGQPERRTGHVWREAVAGVLDEMGDWVDDEAKAAHIGMGFLGLCLHPKLDAATVDMLCRLPNVHTFHPVRSAALAHPNRIVGDGRSADAVHALMAPNVPIAWPGDGVRVSPAP